MDLSAILDVLHSSIPEETKNTIFRRFLDEENYRKLIEWQRINEIGGHDGEAHEVQSFDRGGQGRTRIFRKSKPKDAKEETSESLERSFVANSSCKPVVVGPNDASKKDFQRRGVKLTVKDQEDGKINVNLKGKDQKTLTLVILEIWEKIAKIQKRGERQLSGDQYEIVAQWNETQRANFSIRTGCSLSFVKRKPSGYMITLKAFSREEADAGIAQILVDAKNDAHLNHEDDASDDMEEDFDSFEPMNILLVGLEAVGKSMLINSLANYLKFKRLDDAKNGTLGIITKVNCTVYDKKKKDHTMEVLPTVRRDQDDLEEMPMIYSFNGVVHAQSREIRIIDTLGIPRKGAANDWENVEAVVEAVKKLGEIHAVVLVIDAVEDNLAANFMRVVKNLLQRFHRDILRNVLFCFTRAAGANFNQERVHSALKKFTDEMHQREDMLVHFSNHSSFCFDNKCFADLIGSQNGIDVDLTQASEYWEKSAEQATKFFEKVLELPIFDAKRVVPTLSLNPQVQAVPRGVTQAEKTVPPAKPQNIILIGSEGVGKSMFVNGLANYVKFNSIQAACEETLDVLADTHCNVYDKAKKHHPLLMKKTVGKVEEMEGCLIHTLNACNNLRIVETKGIPKAGQHLTEDNIDWFSRIVLESLKEANSICLLLDAHDAQIDSNFEKVVRPLLHRIPPTLQNQVVFCLTRSGPNFNEENLHKSLTRFVQELNEENIQIRFDRNDNSFCVDNKGFADLYGAKSGIDVDLTQAREFWEKSAVQAKRLLAKIAQCESVQLAESGAETEGNPEETYITLNPAALELLESDLERELVNKMWSTPGGRQIVKKIVKAEYWERFLDLLEESASDFTSEQLAYEEEHRQLESNCDALLENVDMREPSQTLVEEIPPPLPTTAPPEDHPEGEVSWRLTEKMRAQSSWPQCPQGQNQMSNSTTPSESPLSIGKKKKTGKSVAV